MNEMQKFYTYKSERYATANIQKIVDVSVNFCAIFEQIRNFSKKQSAEGKMAEKFVFECHLSTEQIASLIKSGDFDKAYKKTATIYTVRVKQTKPYTYPTGREVHIPAVFEFFSTDEYFSVHGDTELSDNDRFKVLKEFEMELQTAFDAAKTLVETITETTEK